MRSWDLTEIDTPGGRTSPVVLYSGDSRAVLIALEPGQALGDHEVRERAWLTVLEGSIEVGTGHDEWLAGGPGMLVTFDPGERHAVRSPNGARLLLLLAPWPADGHYLPGETPNDVAGRRG